jgi:NTP pyrophosphatase (non-canonical NTP hydrolase)
MSREIHKKLSKRYFDLIASGQKTFELRVADFECEPGDTLILDEYEYEDDDDTVALRSTGRSLRRKVGYVGRTEEFAWLKRPDVAADVEKYGFQAISLLDNVSSRLTAAEQDEILQKFVDAWGVDDEKKIAIEEMAELTKELCKSWRNKTNESSENMAKNEQAIRSEIADVLITVGQLKRIYGVAKVDEIIDYKLRRGNQQVEKYLKNKGKNDDN